MSFERSAEGHITGIADAAAIFFMVYWLVSSNLLAASMRTLVKYSLKR